MARGEWSLGKIIDTYFKFGYGGDCYLGQVLTLKNANSTDFGILPAHWKDLSDKNIDIGVECCFPGLLAKHRHKDHNPSGLLKLLLAQLVYHSDFLKKEVDKNPKHQFGLVPMVFDKPELLAALKKNVTLDPSPDMPMATGIPPHISHSIEIEKVLDICGEVKGAVEALDAMISTSVGNAIDEKVVSEGNVNLSVLTKALSAFRIDMMKDLQCHSPAVTESSLSDQPTIDTTITIATYFTFNYNGKSWAVPLSFAFPEGATLWNAWSKWWLGNIAIDGGKQYKIMAYRHLHDKDMPTTKAKNNLKTNWRPILTKMMQTPGLNVTCDFVPDDAVMKENYTTALNCLHKEEVAKYYHGYS